MARRPGRSSFEIELEVERTALHSDEVLLYTLEVSGDYSPGRPPPPCQDHDHPNFSDPGDDSEFEVNDVKIVSVMGEDDITLELSDHRILKVKDLELTESELATVEAAAAAESDRDDGPDPDEAYERWRDRQDDR